MPVTDFLHLCIAEDEEERQEQVVALLESKPESEAEAKAILSKLHHRIEWHARQQRLRYLPITQEPPADQYIPDGDWMDALQRLPTAEFELIRMHCFDDVPLREIATELDVGYESLRQHYLHVLRKIVAIAEISGKS